ncbi:hypothetical protein GCM10010211_61220 [Streptomyces albospinus]|uniref:Transcriptional regulator n=1 Tax=Streptomyces albospinus TaxID=285515 RepID=A0ABQ2VHG1_9ACTN|nr:hypothetical protein GCM10010211_61220 [Streptomyces albospinus]
MVDNGLITWDPEPQLTLAGTAWMAENGITLPTASRRPLVRSCLDWTERRPHLGGAVGAAICSRALDAGWVTRIGTGRALALTEPGRQEFHERFRVPVDRLPTGGTR